MSVLWHRIVFDPRNYRDNFSNSREFSEWCARNLSCFDYLEAGFTNLRWDHAINHRGIKAWMVIVPGKTEYRTGETDIMRFFAENHWTIDGYDVVMYLRYHDNTNEKIFPIQAGKIEDRNHHG